MMPVIFRIPFINLDVPGYGLMLTIGFLLAIWWSARRAVRSGGNPDVILNLGLLALVTGVVGCRLMFVVHYWDQFKERGGPLQVAWAIIDVSKGGLEFYGGFILTIIVVLAWLHWKEKVSLRWYMDIVAPSAALGLAIGRLGCFLNGCCYGSTCDQPWAVRFPYGSSASLEQWKGRLPGAGLPQELQFNFSNGISTVLSRESIAAGDAAILAAKAEEDKLRLDYDALKRQRDAAQGAARDTETRKIERLRPKLEIAAAKFRDIRTNMEKYGMSAAEIRALAAQHPSLAVHPTQLYSTITAGVIAFLLNALYWRRTRDGQVIFALLLIEPLTRWMLEIIRADNPVDTLGEFTISQFLALLMTAIGLIGLLVLQRMPPRSPRARLWSPEDEAQTNPPSGGKPAKTARAVAAQP